MGGVRRDVTRFRLLQPLSTEAVSRLPSDVVEILETWASEDAGHERADYLHWLRLRAVEHGGEWANAVQSPDHAPAGPGDLELLAWQWLRRHAAMPFPVGRGCPELQTGMPAEALRELMPLSGIEYAASVEAMPDRGGALRGGALLFMCKPVERRSLTGTEWIGDQPVWIPDGSRVVALPVPQRSISKMAQAEAERAWREANGLPSGAGRHPGATYWTPGRIVEALMMYVREQGSKPRNRNAFVIWAYEEIGLPVPAEFEVMGKRWSRALGVPYPELRDAVAAVDGSVWVVEDQPC